jgi:hypothetical protein
VRSQLRAAARPSGFVRICIAAGPSRRLPAYVAACALSLGLLAFAGSAHAISLGHTYDFEFGSAGSGPGEFLVGDGGMGVAIDQSTGNVYVTDGLNSRVQKFDSEGNFLLTWGYGVTDGSDELQTCAAPDPCQEGLYGSAPGQLRHPNAVAIDNSGGPNDGLVYVADTSGPGGLGSEEIGLNQVLVFEGDGTFVRKIDGSGTPSGTFLRLPFRGAVSVDGSGFVWVADRTTLSFDAPTRLMRFSNQPGNSYVGGSEWSPLLDSPGEVITPRPTRVFSFTANPKRLGVYISAPVNGSCCRLLETAHGSVFKSIESVDEDAELTTDPATGHVYVSNGTDIREYDAENIQIVGDAFGSSKLSSIKGLAVNGATSTVYVADPFQPKVIAFKPRIVPDLHTAAATEIGHTSATLHGEAAPDPGEGGDVTECKFEYGLTTDYGSAVPCEPSTPYSTSTQVEAELTNLTMDAVYHYRLVAGNSVGLNFGSDMTFVPRAVLGLNTDPPTEVTATGATLNGSFSPNNEQTNYYFEWGQDESYGNVTAAAPGKDGGSGSGTISVSEPVGELEDYTDYHYRIVATNPLGTSYGPDRVFRTKPPPAPIVTRGNTTFVSDSTAHLTAQVNPNSGDTFYLFEHGATPAYGRQSALAGPIGPDGEFQSVDLDLDGLTPGTTYHYRVVAINFGGVTYGPDSTFRTQDRPTILFSSVLGKTQTTATLESSVSPGLSETMVRFIYGDDTDYGQSTESLPIGAGGVPVTSRVEIGGLSAETTYHFKVVATNLFGTVEGQDQIVSTLAVAQTPRATPSRCKRGFIRRRGRCVRKRHKARKPPKKQARQKRRLGEGR